MLRQYHFEAIPMEAPIGVRSEPSRAQEFLRRYHPYQFDNNSYLHDYGEKIITIHHKMISSSHHYRKGYKHSFVEYAFIHC